MRLSDKEARLLNRSAGLLGQERREALSAAVRQDTAAACRPLRSSEGLPSPL